jgi:Cof subfamily protein (haloacid dehalogenase superfamily)
MTSPSKKWDIRLIAMDLDDTLLSPDKSISPANKEAVRRAFRHGVHIVLASARPISSIIMYARELEIEGYCIGLNGAVVSSVPDGEVLRLKTHTVEFTRELIEFCYDLGPDNLFVEYPDGFSCWNLNLGVGGYLSSLGMKPKWVGDLTKVDEPVCKVVLCKEGNYKSIVDRIKDKFGSGIHMVVWDGYWAWIEILPAGTGKASALNWLTERIGINPRECMAIGDEENDVEMIKWAGLGVAMGQGNIKAKAVADYITSSNSADGCALAINRFVL